MSDNKNNGSEGRKSGQGYDGLTQVPGGLPGLLLGHLQAARFMNANNERDGSQSSTGAQTGPKTEPAESAETEPADSAKPSTDTK